MRAVQRFFSVRHSSRSSAVKTHTLTIYRKLEVANRTQAILRAQELGIFDS